MSGGHPFSGESAAKRHRQRHALGDRDGWVCRYCDAAPVCPNCNPEALNHMTADHVIPKSNGGRGTPDNLVTACLPCNEAKGTGDAEAFTLRSNTGT